MKDYNFAVLFNKVFRSVSWAVVLAAVLTFARVRGWIDAPTYDLIVTVIGAAGVGVAHQTAQSDLENYETQAATAKPVPVEVVKD